jgi:hypothetical protein
MLVSEADRKGYVVLVEGEVALAISCNAVEDAPWSVSLARMVRERQHTPGFVVGRLAHLGLHLGVVHDGCFVLAMASWQSLSRRAHHSALYETPP